MTVVSETNGETTVAGWLVDQSALYGLIGRMRDLGLTLIAVIREEPSDRIVRAASVRRD
jgi:hypothetical protein